MNRYRWVAMTYLRRLRFWVFAACYAGILIWTAWMIPPAYAAIHQMMISANLAPIGCCLVALHARRQFMTPAAHLVPRFASVHLTVAAVASAMAWLLVPAVLSVIGVWPKGAVAIHAVAGLLLAVAACWPKAIAALAAFPVTYPVSIIAVRDNATLLRIVEGREPLVAGGMVLAAVAAHAVAARWLLGMTDTSGSPDEELVLEPSVSQQTSNPWYRWILASRDRATAGLLASAGEAFWSVRRWRVPVAVSPVQLIMPVVLAAVLVAVSIVGREPVWGFLGVLITSCFLLVAPFTAWHWRRRSFASELLRPVARNDFFRQVAIALAMDVVLWTLVASVIGVLAITVLGQFKLGSELPRFFHVQLAVLWGTAAVVYGVALATIRIQYWVVLITLLSSAWLFGYWSLVLWLWMNYHEIVGRGPALMDAYIFAAISAVVGLVVSRIAYRRLLRAEWR